MRGIERHRWDQGAQARHPGLRRGRQAGGSGHRRIPRHQPEEGDAAHRRAGFGRLTRHCTDRRRAQGAGHLACVHQPQGHEGRQPDPVVHVPRLLHRSVPGHGDGEVRPPEPQGPARRVAGGDGWDSAKLYEIAQGALDGGYFSNHYSTENPSATVQQFAKKYQAAYRAAPDAFAALGYDAALLALDAMTRARELTPSAVRDAIEQTATLQGVTGTMQFDADHNPVKSAVITGIEKNAPKYVATVEP